MANFRFSADWARDLMKLDVDDRAEVLDALTRYALNGKEPVFNPLAKPALRRVMKDVKSGSTAGNGFTFHSDWAPLLAGLSKGAKANILTAFCRRSMNARTDFGKTYGTREELAAWGQIERDLAQASTRAAK